MQHPKAPKRPQPKAKAKAKAKPSPRPRRREHPKPERRVGPEPEAIATDATSGAGARASERAERSDREEVDRRIAEVGKYFGKGTWSNQVCRRLAAKWGIATRTVQDYSRQASRLARLTQTAEDIQFERELAANRQDRICLIAMRAGAFDSGMLRVASVAADLKLKALGAHPAQKHEVAGPNGQPIVGLPAALAALSPPATLDELEHFASTLDEEACALQPCRVHGHHRAPDLQ